MKKSGFFCTKTDFSNFIADFLLKKMYYSGADLTAGILYSSVDRPNDFQAVPLTLLGWYSLQDVYNGWKLKKLK